MNLVSLSLVIDNLDRRLHVWLDMIELILVEIGCRLDRLLAR